MKNGLPYVIGYPTWIIFSSGQLMNNLSTSSPTSSLQDKRVWLLKQISYSSSLTLHTCPRKYQLDKLRAIVDAPEIPGSIHFAFGHAVGAGIQEAFREGVVLQDCYLAAFLAWDFPLLEEMEKQRKSFWYALHAIDAAWHLAANLKSEGWELAHFAGVPAVEFSFRVEFPNGYRYRAYVDIILYNPRTGKYKIVEVKTTGSTWLDAAMYGNSAQALSYAIVLDWLVKDYSSYDVLYLVYKAKTQEWESLPFTKTRLVKSEWIRNVLIDCETVERFTAENYFPKHGESCFDYYKPCEYFGTCGYSDEFLGLEDEAKMDRARLTEEEKTYAVDINLEELLKHQLLTLEESVPTP